LEQWLSGRRHRCRRLACQLQLARLYYNLALTYAEDLCAGTQTFFRKAPDLCDKLLAIRPANTNCWPGTHQLLQPWAAEPVQQGSVALFRQAAPATNKSSACSRANHQNRSNLARCWRCWRGRANRNRPWSLFEQAAANSGRRGAANPAAGNTRAAWRSPIRTGRGATRPEEARRVGGRHAGACAAVPRQRRGSDTGRPWP